MKNANAKSQAKRPERAGFTLMEILIVLAILAVIISLVLPNLLGAQKKANIKLAGTQVHSVMEALEMYATDHDGEFPAGGQGLDALMRSPGSDPKWKGPYIKGSKAPADPWGNPIQYNYPGQHQSDGGPDVWSMGPDKQSGTADDINNWGSST